MKTYKIDGRPDLGEFTLRQDLTSVVCGDCYFFEQNKGCRELKSGGVLLTDICNAAFDCSFKQAQTHTETDEHLRDAVSILSRIVHDFGPCLSNVKDCQIAEECMIHKVKLPCPIGDAGDFLRRFK